MDKEFRGSRGRLFARLMEMYAIRSIPTIRLSELAGHAGVSRGTVYRNIPSTPSLYDQICKFQFALLQGMAVSACEGEKDPAIRCASFVFECMRRAELEPAWCKFTLRYAIADPGMFRTLDSAIEQVLNVPAPYNASTPPVERRDIAFMILASMQSVRFGDDDWREAGLKCLRKVLKVGSVPPTIVESLLRKYP